MAEPPATFATVGVAENGNEAVLVTVDSTGRLLDRRRIQLTQDLPTHPYHHEGSWAIGRYADSPWARPVTLDEALHLVDQVHRAAAVGARDGLEELATAIDTPITRIALRLCPVIPDAILDRILDTRAATVADSVLYRKALAQAATDRGWSVEWYRPDEVFEKAAAVMGVGDIDPMLRGMGRAVGPPWQARHKLAAAAAMAAGRGDPPG